MSHAPQGGQAPDQASSGRQTGAAAPPGQIIRKARKAASHPTSHKRHGDTRLATASDRPTYRVSQSPDHGGGTPHLCGGRDRADSRTGAPCRAKAVQLPRGSDHRLPQLRAAWAERVTPAGCHRPRGRNLQLWLPFSMDRGRSVCAGCRLHGSGDPSRPNRSCRPHGLPAQDAWQHRGHAARCERPDLRARDLGPRIRSASSGRCLEARKTVALVWASVRNDP